MEVVKVLRIFERFIKIDFSEELLLVFFENDFVLFLKGNDNRSTLVSIELVER